MALRFRVPVDPAAEDSRPSELASCSASRLLQQELHRYCDGELAGRSFLVAGLRGAGKTWLVEGVIDELSRRSRRGHVPRMRPLRVPLNGPQIFEVLKDRPEDAPPEGLHRWQQNHLFQHVLEKVVLGLHTALSKEFVRCFRAAADRLGDPRLHELAATLEITLPEGPSPAAMREFWRQLDALEGGMLFTDREAFGQGMRELAALSGLGYAYKRVAGELRANLSEHSSSTQTTSTSAKAWETRLADTVKPATSVLAGAAVTAGAASTDLAQAVLLGLATSTVAALVLGFVGERSTRDEESRDFTFLPNTEAVTLDRVLPELIDRLKAAGLAPVIVVDELDKVEHLWNKLESYKLLDHFKKLFAERVFTCLLANRSFLETLQMKEAARPYDVFHSYFTHRTYVSFEPAELHEYLEHLLEPFRD